MLEDVVHAARRQAQSLTIAGLVLGTLFFAASLTPSLVPRNALTQGALAGGCFAIGCGLGVFLRWLWRYMELPELAPRTRSIATIVCRWPCKHRPVMATSSRLSICRCMGDGHRCPDMDTREPRKAQAIPWRRGKARNEGWRWSVRRPRRIGVPPLIAPSLRMATMKCPAARS